MLLVGTNKTKILLPETFMLVDDGALIDTLTFERRKVTHFDPAEHHFNPLEDIDYFRACAFVDVINAVFPEGENTLTKRSSSTALLEALLQEPSDLSHLYFPEKDNGSVDAKLKVKRLLLSPILRRVLHGHINFAIDGIVLVRLNRAELVSFDCFVIANLLISLYHGQVVIPDFGFYGCKFHMSFTDRLTVGVNYLDETPFKNDLLLMPQKIAAHCTAQDAAILAQYEGLTPHSNEYNDFIARSIQ